jgi:hypothetical protein
MAWHAAARMAVARLGAARGVGMRVPEWAALFALALAVSLAAAAPAQAQRDRTFVASYGNDGNSCTFGSPCKTFQGAYAATAPGGEVTAIDSAGFGPLLIQHAITITSPNGVEAGIVAAAGGAAVTITAGASDAVVLRGLTLNGSGTAYDGIVFNSGASLTVTKCAAQNFAYDGSAATTGYGIILQPTGGTVYFAIIDSLLVNNATGGILYAPPSGAPVTTGVINNTVLTGNQIGLEASTSSATGGSTAIAIVNSTISNNSNTAISATGSLSAQALKLAIDNDTISDNGTGISATGFVEAILRRSAVVRNGTGITNATSLSNGFYSYRDNRINQNGTDINTGVGDEALLSEGFQ